jgi:3-oxoacyl-[acyl-carrier-protein] synthase-3
MTLAKPSRHGGTHLAGTGVAIPPGLMTNDDLAKLVDTNDEWITQRTGINIRHKSAPEVTVRHLAVEAIRNALADAQLEPAQLDMVILASITTEMACPSTAARVVAEIGAVPAAAMDLVAACSGFVYGLNVASALIESGHHKNIAVIGAETLTKVTDYTDRRTCVLFGDGAGAAILTASDDSGRGCLGQQMHSDGSLWEELYIPRTQRDLPEPHDNFSGTFNTLQMNGREVFKFAVKTTEQMIDRTLTEANLKPDDLAMIIPHQSNLRILVSARERLGLPKDKLYINIDRYGNTSAASVPIALHELREDGQVKDGDLVLFLAIGGGMTWTTSLWRV